MKNLRVFLADDHPIVREGLRTLVNAQPDMEVVGEAADGETAWREALALAPDVVVMDVSMPEGGGATATARLRREMPEARVLALTVHEDRAYLRELLEAGASGYLLKRAAGTDLIHAIRMVAGGGVYIDPQVAGQVVGSFVRGPAAGSFLPEEAGVSPREQEVLQLIAQGYSNKEIAGRLGVSVKTVETYKARGMEKLGLGSRVEIVRYALANRWLRES